MNNSVVVLGIDWADPTIPVLRTATAGATTSSTAPLVGSWCFQVDDPDTIYCCGWFDLTGELPAHVPCAEWAPPDSGRQCRKCFYREGMATAHQSGARGLAPNVAAYMARPHQLYIDVLADGTIKVGTVAESRLSARLAEQGALAARYVARTPDGATARTLEAAVASRAGLAKQVSAARKLAALATRIDIDALARQLDDRVAQLRQVLVDVAGPEVEVFDSPRPWRLPDVAAAAFATTPLTAYPGALDAGAHSLHVRSATGPLVAFATEPNVDDGLFVANLAPLAGRQVVLGDYRSEIAPSQPALF